jgi:hypothetical protein
MTLTGGLRIANDVSWTNDVTLQPPAAGLEQQFFRYPFGLAIPGLQR